MTFKNGELECTCSVRLALIFTVDLDNGSERRGRERRLLWHLHAGHSAALVSWYASRVRFHVIVRGCCSRCFLCVRAGDTIVFEPFVEVSAECVAQLKKCVVEGIAVDSCCWFAERRPAPLLAAMPQGGCRRHCGDHAPLACGRSSSGQQSERVINSQSIIFRVVHHYAASVLDGTTGARH